MLLINLFSSPGCQKPLRASPHKPKLYIAINQVWIISPTNNACQQSVCDQAGDPGSPAAPCPRRSCDGMSCWTRRASHSQTWWGAATRPRVTETRPRTETSCSWRSSWRPRTRNQKGRRGLRGCRLKNENCRWTLPRLGGLIRLRLSLKLISYLFYWTQKHVSFSSCQNCQDRKLLNTC